METARKFRDSNGNVIMSVRDEKIKTLGDIAKDIGIAIIIVGVVVLVAVVMI